MGFMDDIAAESKQYGGGSNSGDYFKFDKKGDYKMRILVQPKVTATHFFGSGKGNSFVCVGIEEGCPYHGAKAPKDDSGKEKRPSIKLATYVIDRNDEKIKLAELPLSISYSLNDLQEDEEYAFDEFPMPYDIKIKYDPDNSDPKAKYRLIASATKKPLTEEETGTLAAKMEKQTPEQYVEGKKKRQKEKGVTSSTDVGVERPVDYPTEDINPDDIPF